MNARLFATLALLAAALVVPVRAQAALPRPAHVVIVVDENQASWQVIGNAKAPYLNALAQRGAIFTEAHGVTHPSLPNYLALFAGVTNTNGDDCPAAGFSRTAPNLASELLRANLTFAAYSEDLPSAGFTGCWAGDYGRKHAPWVEFTNVPQRLHRPFAALHSYDRDLATVTFIIPNLIDDMHDAPVATGDAWARAHVEPLARWAATHDTLLIFTWDEGYDKPNSIPTFFVGPMVKRGRYAQRIDHYVLLRTVEAMYGLAPSGAAAKATPIDGVWR